MTERQHAGVLDWSSSSSDAGADRRTSRRVRRVLLPVDLAPSAKRALEWTIAFGSERSVRIYVLHVKEPSTGRRRWKSLEILKATLIDLVTIAQSRARAKARLAVRVEAGWARELIVTRAATQRCDLIVMSRREGRDGEEDRIGGVTEFVLTHAPCPVLVLPDA